MTIPALPYNDPDTGHTSGHASSATSTAHAHAQDLSGQTQNNQERALTAKEFGFDALLPHQAYSSVMSNLHKKGKIERLLEQRKGSEVYVLPAYVKGRPLSLYQPNAAARKLAHLLDMVNRADQAGATAIRVDALLRVLS
jgi:hypothetical protein